MSHLIAPGENNFNRPINRYALAPFFSSYPNKSKQEKSQILDVGAGSGQLARELSLERAAFADLPMGRIKRYAADGPGGPGLQ
ncbi:MAG: hypothetical protein WBG37_16945 [Desulfobacterales bacterium]